MDMRRSLWLTNKSMWGIVIRLTSLMTHFRFSLKKKHINVNKYIKGYGSWWNYN